jgi:hypothetical protein
MSAPAPESPARRHRLAAWALLSACAVFLTLLAAVFCVPQDIRHRAAASGLAQLPGCPIRQATGRLCPGCGGLRAAVAAADGRWAEAMRWNPALPAAAALAAYGVAVGVSGCRNPRQFHRLAPGWLWWVVVAAVAVFTVVRNLAAVRAWQLT